MIQIESGRLTRGNRIARIAFWALRGVAIGVVMGALAGATVGFALIALRDWFGPEPAQPPIEDYSILGVFLLAVIGIPAGALVFGIGAGVASWIATSSPEKAEQRRLVVKRLIAFAIPVLLGVGAGLGMAHVARDVAEVVHPPIPFEPLDSWNRRAPDVAVLGAFLACVILGVLVGLDVARSLSRRRRWSAGRRLVLTELSDFDRRPDDEPDW